MSDLLLLTKIIYLSVFFMFIPGYFLSFLLYENPKLDFIERVSISFALSISIVPILLFILGLVGIKTNYGLVIIAVTSVAFSSQLIRLYKVIFKNKFDKIKSLSNE